MTVNTNKLYNKFLITECLCYPDDNNLHPCDKGTLCGRCLTEEMNEKWRALKASKKNIKPLER